MEAFLPPIESEKWTTEIVVSVHYWTLDADFIPPSRSCGFRFTPGQYARLGLAGAEGIDVLRPISVVSAANDEALEFLVVLIPGGAFSEALGRLKTGDTIKVESAVLVFCLLINWLLGAIYGYSQAVRFRAGAICFHNA